MVKPLWLRLRLRHRAPVTFKWPLFNSETVPSVCIIFVQSVSSANWSQWNIDCTVWLERCLLFGVRCSALGIRCLERPIAVCSVVGPNTHTVDFLSSIRLVYPRAVDDIDVRALVTIQHQVLWPVMPTFRDSWLSQRCCGCGTPVHRSTKPNTNQMHQQNAKQIKSFITQL